MMWQLKSFKSWASVVVQPVKLLTVTLISRVGVLIRIGVPNASLQIQFLANGLRRQQMTLLPMWGNQDGAMGSWLFSGPAPAIVVIW